MSTVNLEPGSLSDSFAACLDDINQLSMELRQRAQDRERMDELLRITSLAGALTREETIDFQEKTASERNEYQDLQDAYVLTRRRIGSAAVQAQRCLINGFPETEQFSDEFEVLLTRYRKAEILPEVFILKLHALMRRAAESISDAAKVGAATRGRTPTAVGDSEVEHHQTIRRPDIETSRRRVALHDQLSTELATISQAVKKHTTVEKLRSNYPQFKLWTILSDAEQRGLLAGEFKPRTYAGYLALRQDGLTSLDTLKKDRKKLRGAQNRRAAP